MTHSSLNLSSDSDGEPGLPSSAFTEMRSAHESPTVPTSTGIGSSAPDASRVRSPASKIRRRNRMITSCFQCRRRKLKCNKTHPCENCARSSRECIFLAPTLDEASQLRLATIKEKVGSLERLLEQDFAKNTVPGSAEQQEEKLQLGAEDSLPPAEDEKDLKPVELSLADAAYEFDGEDDDVLDLGFLIGKMRLTERIGGFFRPKFSQEVASSIEGTSWTKGQEHHVPKADSLPQPPRHLSPASEWLAPTAEYIIPSSGFFFGGIGSRSGSLMDYLPARPAADKLIQQYFIAVHPICHLVHRPTFEKEYDHFWEKVSLGIEPPSSVQSIIFAAMFSGVVSMDESLIFKEFGVNKSSLQDNFRSGTEAALTRANFLRTTKIKTLQAFVMYLIPLCRSELSRTHSVLLVAAIKMAECMGIHRDGGTYGMNPLETHIRRLIWYQLCFLDIRTCEAQGPRPTIRRDEFDTSLPLNADDTDFHATKDPPEGLDRWTDATFCLMRFEINEMMRTIWVDRPRIESRDISLAAVLSKIETFRVRMAKKYDHLMDDNTPVQHCAKHVKALLLSRLYVMVLHRYQKSVSPPMPDRLRKILVASAVNGLESAVALDTLPHLQTWQWYGGALQQYHIGFLLLMEVILYPQTREADRIWACLDYIFECNTEEARQTKAERILWELQEKTSVYSSMRRMRAPVERREAGGENDHLGTMTKRRHRASQLVDVTEQLSEASPSFTRDSHSGNGLAHMSNYLPRSSSMQDVVFAGCTDSRSLWALPSVQTASPQAITDFLSASEHQPSGMAPAKAGDLMADVDWAAFDALFPADMQAELGL